VTRGDNQFAVSGLPELIELAQQGELDAGDMVQPPETSEWVYASEIPGLVPHLSADDDDDDDLDYKPSRSILPMVLLAGLVAVVVVGGLGVIGLLQMLPDGNERIIGADGLSYSEVIVTASGASLAREPDPKATGGTPVDKDSALSLLAKRGDFYRVKTKGGDEGWIATDQVLPMYLLGDAKVKEQYDPLYNPDRYVDVVNASWIALPLAPGEKPPEDGLPTTFHFMFGNESAYDMTDLVVKVTIKDASKAELGQLEIPITGAVPKNGTTMVGQIQPEEEDGEPVFITEHSFKLEAVNDPALQERWEPGITMKMEGDAFDNASVDILELRAVPPEE
jgi:hypothetical protein